MNNERVKQMIFPIQKIGKGDYVIGSTNAMIMHVLMVFLTFFTLLTPRDALGLKKAFLGLTLVFSFRSVINGLKRNFTIFMIAVVIPVLMYFLSTMMTGSYTKAISYLYPFVYLLLVFPIVEWNIDIEKIVLYVGNVMAFIIVASCVLDFVGVLSIYGNPVLMWLDSHGEAKISKSVYAMFRYVLFFNASPVLFYNLMYYVKKNQKILLSFIFVALLFTGTRANIYLSAALLVGSMLFYSKKISTKLLIIGVAVAVIVFFGNELLARFYVLSSAKSAGDMSRVGGFGSIVDILNRNKTYWFTGMGFGSVYYNAGKIGYVETSELSYLEFIREIGLPFTIIVVGYLIYPLVRIYRKDRYTFAFYAAYLVAGILEPFIFTSTGLFIVTIMYVRLTRMKLGNRMIEYRCV